MTRLLLIEDDPQLSKILEISLNREGYEVDLITDGALGFERAQSAHYDGIVLDWTLPGMTGLEVCQGLRKAGSKTPIIMLTGRSAHSDKINGLDMGADDYLTKPFSADELYARLRAVLRRRGPAQIGRLQIADLVLNTSTRTVNRDEAEIHLMPKEFELLTYFMQNPDVALSRDTILKEVWDIEAQNSSNRLDVYVQHLRRKIDDEHDKKLLHTVRGVGYKIVS